MKLKEPMRVGSFYVKIAPSPLSLRTAGATFEPMYARQMDCRVIQRGHNKHFEAYANLAALFCHSG